MALARFFEKTALAASHILQGFDRQTFADSLESKKISVFFDSAAENAQEGRWTLQLAINLIARLYPNVSIVTKNESALLKELVAIVKSINPRAELGHDLKNSSACLVVGENIPPVDAPLIYVGSQGWITKISAHSPVGSANSRVPFGADAAACIGVANLFRATFKSQLEDGRLDEKWHASLFDLNPLNMSPANPEIGRIDFAETHLVGIGAIGNGCIWSLSRMRNMRGTLHLIEDQAIELSNLQRYVLTNDVSEGRAKVELAKEHLVNSGLNVLLHQCRWEAYLSKRNNWRIPRVAVAVDSAEDRRAIQAALPEWIVNAWTQLGDLGVSRHNFLSNQACLMCLYSSGPRKNEDESIAEVIGLPEEKLNIRRMLMTNEPLDNMFLTKIANAMKINITELARFEGESLRLFHAQAICGGTLLHLGANPISQRAVQVPMAFQSALAGTLLAAELVAKAAGLKSCPPPVTTKLDLLRPLGPYLSFSEAKASAGCCICQDADYIDAFKQKYSVVYE